MLHLIHRFTIRLFTYMVRGLFAAAIVALLAVGWLRLDLSQVIRQCCTFAPVPRGPSPSTPRPAARREAASASPIPERLQETQAHDVEPSPIVIGVRPATTVPSEIEFTVENRPLARRVSLPTSAASGLSFPNTGVPASPGAIEPAEVIPATASLTESVLPVVQMSPLSAVTPQPIVPSVTAPPPVEMSVPLGQPQVPAIHSEVVPVPVAAPLVPAMPVAPPPVATARIGAFVSQGTITPADVRAMALRSNKEIAVLGYAPSHLGTFVDTEASEFDPAFNVALMGGNYHRQVSNQVEALGPPIPELKTSFWQPINGPNQIYLEKLFTTGGRLQVGLGQNYTMYNPAGTGVFVNPAYQSSLNLQLDQPLFRGRGPEWNTALLQIARANQQQSWHSFIATVSQILRDADYAYWDLYAAFQDWEARDLAVRQADETLQRERGRLQIGEGSVPDVAQAEEQYEAFEIARADAENRLINAQRNLRRVMGLPPSDPRPLVPAEPASDAPVELDWNYAAEEARRRPELAAQQAAVDAAQAELARRRNGLLPDLSVRAIYAVSGLDDSFDQAWNTVGNVQYDDWTAGIIYRQPLGRRADRAAAARAELSLAMETARLRQLELEVLHQLDAALQHVQNTQRLLEMHRKRREAAAVQLTARRELYFENRASLREQLDAELRYASALYDESNARVAFQRALTEWNFARGALAEAGIAAGR